MGKRWGRRISLQEKYLKLFLWCTHIKKIKTCSVCFTPIPFQNSEREKTSAFLYRLYVTHWWFSMKKTFSKRNILHQNKISGVLFFTNNFTELVEKKFVNDLHWNIRVQPKKVSKLMKKQCNSSFRIFSLKKIIKINWFRYVVGNNNSQIKTKSYRNRRK